MAMEDWWEVVKTAVAAYTGMTPAAFFTVVAVSATLYVTMSGFLARPARAPRTRRREDEAERAFQPLPPPAQLGKVTEEELRAYDGSDPKKPLLMALKGQIYDVTQSRMFYGPGGPYASFAGRDASRALAKMSFDPNDLTSDVSGLSPFEVETLQEWECKFKSKYVAVGTIEKTIPVAEGDTVRSAMTMAAVTVDRDIDASTIQGNVPELIIQGSVVEKTRETLDAGVNASRNEDVEEKAKELPALDVLNTNSHAVVVQRPEETPNVSESNNRRTEDAVDPEGTPQVVDENNTSKTEDATERPNEVPDTDILNNTVGQEDAGQHKETLKVDENDLSCHQSTERPKVTSDVEVKHA